MANITIRDLPDNTKEALRIHAAQSGISLEAYARHILQTASSSGDFKPADILSIAEKYFGSKQGVDLALPERRAAPNEIRLIPDNPLDLIRAMTSHSPL